MSSFINQAKSIVTGREKLGITGIYNKEKVTIDLDVTITFNTASNSETAKFPIEPNDSSEPVLNVSDHVISKPNTINLDCYISDNLNLVKSVISLSRKSITLRDKISILTYWQKNGTLLNLEGYTTGGIGILNKLASKLSLYNSKVKEPWFLGLDKEVIENLVISGTLQIKRTIELGSDVQLLITLERIIFAKANNGSKDSQPKGTNPPSKGEAKPSGNQTPKATEKIKSFVAKGAGKT